MDFLRGLAKNNKREWFQPRKEQFDLYVKAPMIELVEALNAELAAFAPEFITEPKKAVYRIYRDTRFSKDKTPYKTHIAGNFFRYIADKHAGGGFYFSVGPDQIEIAGGVYMPGPEELRKLRHHIEANYEEFNKLLANRNLKTLMGELKGDSLSRAPKSFLPGHPAEAWIRRKQWYFYSTDLPPALAVTPKFLPELAKRMKAMLPVVTFLNRAIVPTHSRSAFHLDH